MKIVVQRVKEASVTVDEKLINKIDQGLLLFVGFHQEDTEEDILKMIKKIVNLRIFADENDLMNKSILDIQGSILSISQFTLYANVKKGNRPSFIEAMNPNAAQKNYDIFNQKLNEYVPTYAGVFGADMQIKLINDGPVTIIIDSKI